MELLCKHYQNLVVRLQPVKVSEYMFAKGLLSKKYYTLIMNAPCDRIKNSVLIEHVRHHSSSYLFTFLDVLLEMKDQRYLYETLINGMYVRMCVCILYVAWVDQWNKMCFIFHKVPRVLYGNRYEV